MNVVITGGSKGIGYALAEEFAARGHRVLVSARDAARLEAARAALSSKGAGVLAIPCDVSDAGSVRALAEGAKAALGRIDLWINNAGSNGYSNAPVWEAEDASLRSIVGVNLLGPLLCAKYAFRAMRDQGAGHIFMMDGYGADGTPTPGLAAYGATKRALPQLVRSLNAEAAGTGVGFHALSPGMVLTELLLRDSSPAAARVFAILADPAPLVARWLVRKVLSLRPGDRGRYFRRLTKPKAFLRFLAAPVRIGRRLAMVEAARARFS